MRWVGWLKNYRGSARIAKQEHCVCLFRRAQTGNACCLLLAAFPDAMLVASALDFDKNETDCWPLLRLASRGGNAGIRRDWKAPLQFLRSFALDLLCSFRDFGIYGA